jgi:hypothetical protein
LVKLPDPDTTPPYVKASDRLKITAPSLTTDAFPIEPDVPPKPICNAPATTVTPPANALFPANVNIPNPVLRKAKVPAPPSNTPEKTVSVPSPAVNSIAPATDEVTVPPCPLTSDKLNTVCELPAKSNVAPTPTDNADVAERPPTVP